MIEMMRAEKGSTMFWGADANLYRLTIETVDPAGFDESGEPYWIIGGRLFVCPRHAINDTKRTKDRER